MKKHVLELLKKFLRNSLFAIVYFSIVYVLDSMHVFFVSVLTIHLMLFP